VGIPITSAKTPSWPASDENKDNDLNYPRQLTRSYYFDARDSSNNSSGGHENMPSNLHKWMNLYTKDGFMNSTEHGTEVDIQDRMNAHDGEEEDTWEREDCDRLTSSDPSIWSCTPIVWNFTSLSAALTKYLQPSLSTHRDQSVPNMKLMEELVKWTKDSHDMTGNALFWGVQKLVMIHSNLAHLCTDHTKGASIANGDVQSLEAEMVMHLTIVP